MSLCHFALSWFLLHKTSSVAFAIKSNNSLNPPTNLLSVGRTMSALSPVRITSWANASLVEDDVCVTGMECTGSDAASEAPVSAEPSLHVMVGADVQPDTRDEHESEHEKLPPHTESDNPADGLQCYVEGCGRHYFSWKSLLKHVRKAHRKQQSSFRGTALHEVTMREQREEDRARYHKKRGKPCLPKKDRARSLKADAAATPAPPPTKEQPSEPSATSSEHVAGPLVWKHPQECCTPEMKGSFFGSRQRNFIPRLQSDTGTAPQAALFK